MSDEQPDALELLAIARETLLEQVLPALHGDARYQVLMIANAIAIASRELRPGAVDLAAELEFLHGLYVHDAPPAHERVEQALQRLEARLARDLRGGELDGGPQLAVRRLLRRRIESRLALSNPTRLARARATPGGGGS